MHFIELTDEEWSHIAALLPAEPLRHTRRGRPRASPRAIVNAILWVLTTGRPWSRLPVGYPSVPTCRRRFDDWLADGTLAEMTRVLAGLGRTLDYWGEELPEPVVSPALVRKHENQSLDEMPRLRGVFWTNPETWHASPSPEEAGRPQNKAVSPLSVSGDEHYQGYVIRATAEPSVRSPSAFRASAEIWKDGKRVERSGLIGPCFDDSGSAQCFARQWAHSWVRRQPSVFDEGGEGADRFQVASIASRQIATGIAPTVSMEKPQWLLQLLKSG